METLLLPGLDGTGTLLEPFMERLEGALAPRLVTYPREQVLSYDELLASIVLPAAERVVIVAESFSGPLGVRLAAAHPSRVAALVLVASFVRTPLALLRVVRPLLGPWMFAVRPPALALRLALLGRDADDAQVDAIREAIASVAPEVMAARLAEVARTDVRDALAEVRAPILYLAGARDRVLGERVRAEITSVRPDVTVEVLDAPHLVLQRCPDESARVVTSFLHSD